MRRVGRVVAALLIVGLAALLLAGGFAIWTLRNSEDAARLVQHTSQVELAIEAVGSKIERSEAARRGYLLQQQPVFRETWEGAQRDADETSARLQALVADNPEQQARATRLHQLVNELRRLEQESVRLVDGGSNAAALASFRTDSSAGLLREIRAIRAEMGSEEARLLSDRTQGRQAAVSAFYAVLTICALLVLAIIAVCIVVIRRYTGALALSQRELRRLNVDLEGAVSERTTELQRANEEIQRFAYIVSHDLRSPLVNVMGFTAELESAREPLVKLVAAAEQQAPDLVTREAKMAVDEDLPEAVRFIRTSTEKMDRLINAILRLSREGRRNLSAERLAMTELAQKAADGLKHRAEELEAEIVVEPLPEIVSDRIAIEQIVSNLLENAVKYLKPGRPGRIRMTGRAQGGRALIEISDNGRGIDPRDHQRIFDLFRRSGTQDQPGEGIGLAHVRSLVWRLGGTIEVESALDEGATFRLSLPLRMDGDAA